MFINKNKIYNNKQLDITWSQPCYVEKYIDLDKTWSWGQLPNFDLNESRLQKPNSKIEGSILEIGSATGGAYKFYIK